MPATELVARFGSPLYVYEEDVIRDRCRLLRAALDLPRLRLLYACKANSNRTLLGVIREEGYGIDAVSPGEVEAALRAGFLPEEISFTGNNVSDADLRFVAGRGVHVTVDSLPELDRFGRLFAGGAVAIRVNPDVGGGHHSHVITGGPDAKFGIDAGDLRDVPAIAARHGVLVDGLHQHIGSGILDRQDLLRAVDALLDLAAPFRDLRFLDFGGGLGVPDRRGRSPFDVLAFGRDVAPRLRRFRQERGAETEFRFEPGRFLVAESGTLLATVTSVKRTRRHTFAGTDSGFNHLVRPILYGAFHEIENASAPDGPVERYTVAGNICESGDLFAVDRPLPRVAEGHILAVRNTGAYGFSMGSNYNLRPLPAEVLVKGGNARLIRRRQTLDDLLGDAPEDSADRPPQRP